MSFSVMDGVNMGNANKVSVCFVSETGRGERPIQDPSVRYRCYHPAEVLSRNGAVCAVYSASSFYKCPNLNFDVYVFHRPSVARAGFSRVIESLKKAGKTLVAEYDDLIFGDEDIAMESSAVKNKTLTPEKAVTAFSNNLEALRFFDKISVSTDPLAGYASQYNPGARVHITPNIMPPSFIELHGREKTIHVPRENKAIGYFAGTKSHDRDFPIVAEVLHRVLLENRESSLMIVGPVAVPPGIAALPNVTVAPIVNFLRLPSLMTMCSTVIAPLEMSSFNACKSRVKFLEAALSGCHLIASPIPDMQKIGAERMTLAESKDDWYQALSSFVDDFGEDNKKSNFDYLCDNCNVNGLSSFWSDLK